MRKCSVSLAVWGWLVLAPLTTNAWNLTGHRTVALIAYRQLDEGTRQKVAVTGVKRSLKKGDYTLTVSASPVHTSFVGPSLRSLVHVR